MWSEDGQKNVVKRRDLGEWESEYGGTSAEAIARRVINKYRPSEEELNRAATRVRAKKGNAGQAGSHQLGSEEDAVEEGEKLLKAACSFEYDRSVYCIASISMHMGL